MRVILAYDNSRPPKTSSPGWIEKARVTSLVVICAKIFSEQSCLVLWYIFTSHIATNHLGKTTLFSFGRRFAISSYNIMPA